MSKRKSDLNALTGFVGVDVAKLTVTIFDASTGYCRSLRNTPQALREALQQMTDRTLFVCEATGGYERALLETAFALGLAIHRADAAKVKAFILSHGGNAKTDPEDARWLARYGAERNERLARWSPPLAEREQLGELVRARNDFIAERTRARNRREAPGGKAVADLLDRHIAYLDALIEDIDLRMSECVKACEDLKRAEAELCKQKGTGKTVARTLLALLPELGTLSAKQTASLAGLAPHARQSGNWTGHQNTYGGRQGLRPILFMAALSASRRHPALSAFYEAMLARGKAKKLALTAVARKIVVIANAVLRDLQKKNAQLT